MISAGEGGVHMNDLEIASYLDRGLSDADRARIEDHMVDCSECRHNVAEAQQLVATLRRPRRHVFAVGGLIAVAAAALIVVAPQLKRSGQPLDLVTRDEIASSALEVYEPTGDVLRRPANFVWGSARDAVSYRITLSSAEGTTMWSASVPDTTAALPDSVTLRAGTKYVWFVDAILGDGSTRSTGLRQLISDPTNSR
jgi:hypothetical protein